MCPESIDLNAINNIVHPQWELSDPNPDLRELFTRFNGLFFENIIPSTITIKWNKRLKVTAGFFDSKLIEIQLSERIFKNRLRKDIVHTLLVNIPIIFVIIFSSHN